MNMKKPVLFKKKKEDEDKMAKSQRPEKVERVERVVERPVEKQD